MRRRVLLLVPLVIVATAFAVPALSKSSDVDALHKYTIGIDGAEGTVLQMLLVAKPSASGAPARKLQTITVPFETTFEASSFFVWFDTLEGGKDGDRFRSIYRIDGELQGEGFGGRVKTGNKQTFGFGNL
jgi:hypothetical protein